MHPTARKIRTGVVAGLLALAVAVPATTSAAPLIREHYSGTDSWSFDDCGFDVDATVTFSGLFMLKTGRAGDSTPYYFDNYSFHETFANADTSAWIAIDHDGLYKDLRIEHLEGTTYEFTAMETGQPFVVSDSDGNVILRDRGLLRVQFTVDTMGDEDLDNDVFVDGTWSLLKDAGAHPGFYLDFCALLTDTIG